MAKVLFNREDEFIDELRLEFKDTPGRIVRITCSTKTYQIIAPLKSLNVRATVKSVDEKDVITLERYCGDIWPGEPHNKGPVESSEAVMAKITAACAELGLTVRAGIFEENNNG